MFKLHLGHLHKTGKIRAKRKQDKRKIEQSERQNEDHMALCDL